MAVITISKEFDTQSDEVAAKLSERLGYETVGNQLVAEIGKDLHLSESEVNTFRQTSKSAVLRYLDKFTCSIVQKVVSNEQGCLDDKAYHEKTKELVENLYAHDNVVILGWGGQCILKGKPNVLHVRLRKDDEKKIASLMDNDNMDRDSAVWELKSAEDDSRAYIKHYFKADWNDVGLYDLVIDMGKSTVDEAVDLISENLNHKTKV